MHYLYAFASWIVREIRFIDRGIIGHIGKAPAVISLPVDSTAEVLFACSVFPCYAKQLQLLLL